MKNVMMIHSYNGDTKDAIAPYVESFCKDHQIPCYFPEFPVRDQAHFQSWKKILDVYADRHILNKDSIIIAHSLGTLFTVKYLACRNMEINTYISVAGFVNFSGREDLETIIERFKPTDDNFKKCRRLISNRYSIYSDNDKLNSVKNLEDYADLLLAEKILIPGGNHFDPQSPILHLTQIEEIIIANTKEVRKTD